ncbi:MAG TPA: DUF4337 family protein [Solirubrobacterales bacterium]|nr:DUF4337 family protein [Solirubrobacterales bacterium]
MEAHRSYERFDQGREVAAGDWHPDPNHARLAAIAVAVMAALLAIATFLANEAVKEVVTGETHRADTSAQLESNLLNIEINEGDSSLLKVLGQGTPAEREAAAHTRAHEAKIVEELEPRDARLQHEISDHEHEVDDANSQHVSFELAEVGLEVGIVLASVSIIVSRRWLLGLAGAAATAGVVLLLVGLLL